MKEYIPDRSLTTDRIIGKKEEINSLRDSVMKFLFYENLPYQEKPCRALAVYGPNGCGKSFILDAVLNETIEASKDAGKKLFLKNACFERMRTADAIMEFDKYMQFLSQNQSYNSIIIVNPADQLLFPFNRERRKLRSFLSSMYILPANSFFILEATHSKEEQFEPDIQQRMESVYISNDEKDLEKIMHSILKSRD